MQLWKNDNKKYKQGVYRLPKILGEKSARFHVNKMEVQLTPLNRKQADCLNLLHKALLNLSIIGIKYS